MFFWKKAQNIFANDSLKQLKVVSLKQTNHDKISHATNVLVAVEELKRFLVTNSLEDLNKKIDKLYIALILRSPNSDFDHSSDHILVVHKTPSMDNLVSRLLQVPNLVKDENSTKVIETSTKVAP